jgi:hypothetical protein
MAQHGLMLMPGLCRYCRQHDEHGVAILNLVTGAIAKYYVKESDISKKETVSLTLMLATAADREGQGTASLLSCPPLPASGKNGPRLGGPYF